MLNLLYSVLFFTLFTSQTFAHLHNNEEQDNPFNVKPPDDIESFQGINHEEAFYGCSGYVRAGYIQTEQDDHSSAIALGGELGCGYRLNQYIKAHLGIFASLEPGLNSDDNIHSEFFNSKNDSYLIVGEAVLTLSYKNIDAYLGRQKFDSPHMDGDDLRMIANLFEAYLVDYHFSDELTIGSGFVRQAAGWENGANASQFVSVGEAFGGKSSGAWVSWLNYQQQNYTSDIWFYYIPDHMTIFYSDFIFSDELYDSVSYSLGVQYDWGSDIGNNRLGEVDAHSFGVMAALTWADFTLTTAYNKNFGNTSAIASIGGGPFFTSLEDQTLDVVEGGDSQAILMGLEYQINDSLGVGAMVGKFNASNRNDYNKEESNLYINYNWGEVFAAELIYAVVDDLNKEPDLHQLRVILTYQY